MTEDGDRPADSWFGARGQEKVKVDFVGSLHLRHPCESSNRRNVFTRMDFIVRREILSKGDLADGSRETGEL